MGRKRPFSRWVVAGVVVTFLVPLGACSVLGFGGVSTDHRSLDGEWSDAGVPGSVSEVSWDWVAEGYSGDLELSALPGGVLVRTSREVVALDGVTGEERWSFTVEDEGVHAWTDVSSAGERVHVLFPKEASEEEAKDTEGDVSEGVPGRRVVLDGVTGEIVGDLEETITGDIEELGVFDVELATEAGLFGLGTDPLLSGSMRSDEDGSELWRTEDIFTCTDSNVESAQSPVIFNEVVVVRAECGSGESQVAALAIEDGSILWRKSGDNTGFLTEEGTLREVGGLLAVHQGFEGEHLHSESVVLDPRSGEPVGEGPEIGEEWYLARTVSEGFLLSRRSEADRTFGFALRGFDGDTVATGENAVRTNSVGSYLLPLEEALIKLEPGGTDGGSAGVVTVAPWGAEEPYEIALDASPAASSRGRDTEGRFEAVPGAVVLVDLSDSKGEGTKVIGLR